MENRSMNDKFILGAGQSHHLEHAFRRGEWTTDEVHRLGSGDVLRDVREVIDGFSKITPVEYVFDASAEPMVPEGVAIKAHREHGTESVLWRYRDELYLNGKRIVLKEVEDRAQEVEYIFEHILTEPNGINATVMNVLAKMPRGFVPWPHNLLCVYFPGTEFVSDYNNRTFIGRFGCDQSYQRWGETYDGGRFLHTHLFAYVTRVAVLEN